MRLDDSGLKLHVDESVEYPEVSDIGGISLQRDVFGAFETIDTLDNLGEVISIFATRAIVSIISDLLARAQPRVPVDTGQLRRSGRAWVKFYPGTFVDVAWGDKAGGVGVDPQRAVRRMKGVTYIEGRAGYSRLNEAREDIAQWTHEQLLPFDASAHPRARTPGTGPKYLELPWLEKRNEYYSFLKSALSGQAFETNLAKTLNRRTKKAHEYTIDYYEVNLERAWRIGYFESAFNLK